MNKKQFEARFRAADTLYREQRYNEALLILDELDVQFPNTRNILWPRAGCMYRMRMFDEAEKVCETLIALFNDERAMKLRKKARKRSASDSALDSLGLGYSLLTESDLVPTAPPEVTNGKRAIKIDRNVVLAIGAIALVVFLAIAVFMGWLSP
jgi:hypothetical protein